MHLLLRADTNAACLLLAKQSRVLAAHAPTSAAPALLCPAPCLSLQVPYRLLKSYHKIQQRLVRELEKKFSGGLGREPG